MGMVRRDFSRSRSLTCNKRRKHFSMEEPDPTDLLSARRLAMLL
jgi:hypothetical protein